MAYKIQQASKSPRKKAALKRVGVLEPLNLFEQNMQEHIATMTKKMDKQSKEERRRLVSVLVRKSTQTITGMSKRLGQRWHFVKAASCLPIEEEEMDKTYADAKVSLQQRCHGNRTPDMFIDEVKNFYGRPDASIVIPDKRMVKKDLVPISCLPKSLKRFYQDFTEETGLFIFIVFLKGL